MYDKIRKERQELCTTDPHQPLPPLLPAFRISVTVH